MNAHFIQDSSQRISELICEADAAYRNVYDVHGILCLASALLEWMLTSIFGRLAVNPVPDEVIRNQVENAAILCSSTQDTCDEAKAAGTILNERIVSHLQELMGTVRNLRPLAAPDRRKSNDDNAAPETPPGP